jgi:hypothetical protein
MSKHIIGVGNMPCSKDTINWKERLRILKLASIKIKTPNAYDASGGSNMKLKLWSDSNANGLTSCIIDWITLNGGSATRINCTGLVRKINGVTKYVPSSTRRGTADIHACIKGRHCSIEVKIGADSMSEYQYNEQARITAAGGLYYVAKDMASFVEWYSNSFHL